MTTTHPPNALHQPEEMEFNRVYMSLHRELAAYARFKCDTKQTAEDVLQKVWLKAHLENTIASCGGDLQRIAAYLRKMVSNQASDDAAHERSQRNKAVGFWRSLKARVKEPERPDQHALARDLDGHLAKAIRKLPPRCAEVFILVRYLHKSYDEAAEELGISVTTVPAHLRTAKLRLQDDPAVAYYLFPDVEGEGKEHAP